MAEAEPAPAMSDADEVDHLSSRRLLHGGGCIGRQATPLDFFVPRDGVIRAEQAISGKDNDVCGW